MVKGAWVTVLYSCLLLFAFGQNGGLVGTVEGAKGASYMLSDTMKYAEEELAQIQAESARKQKEEEEKKKKEEKQIRDYLQATIADMSVEEKLAQMMIMTHEKDMTSGSVSKNQPGGIIFFGFDFTGKTVEQVRTRVDELQVLSNIPMFICVDEEGGDINRVAGMRNAKDKVFEAARSLGEIGDEKRIREQTSKKCQLLKELGININFDPVADITTNAGSYMYQRSAGSDAAQVSFYVENVVDQMKQENVISCLKHFPGYGDYGNTHVNYILDGRTIEEYEASDFIPFQTGIEQGADMIMVSHLVMCCFDQKTPASLSKKAHEYIRDELQFDGVIITDDLNMAAVKNRMDLATASAMAVEAGNDMLFSADINQSIEGIKRAIAKGTIEESQIDASVYRILYMKYKHRIMTRSEE